MSQVLVKGFFLGIGFALAIVLTAEDILGKLPESLDDTSLSVIVAMVSALIALMALLVALLTEWRTHIRFKKQLEESSVIARATTKPILVAGTQTYVNAKGVTLHNNGTGPALIRRIRFYRASDPNVVVSSLKDLFVGSLGYMPGDYAWNDYWIFHESKQYVLKAEGRWQLLEVTQAGLKKQGCESSVALELLEQLGHRLGGIVIEFEYEDVWKQEFPFSDKLEVQVH